MSAISLPLPLQQGLQNIDKQDSPVIVVLDLPSTLLIDGLVTTRHGLVADNVDLVAIWADELLQDAADDGRHAGRDDDGRDVVGQCPLEVLVEVWVEGDVLDQVVDALRERASDRVHHLAESVPDFVSEELLLDLKAACVLISLRWRWFAIYLPEGLLAVEDILVALLALLGAVADGVCLLIDH